MPEVGADHAPSHGRRRFLFAGRDRAAAAVPIFMRPAFSRMLQK
jgi:hypothetical protein